MNWISVEDERKPAHRAHLLLVIDEDGNRWIEPGTYWAKSGDFIAEASPTIGQYTTHWMLMPALPAEGD